MKKINILTVLALSAGLWAQETRHLTLEEAVQLGVSNSKLLQLDAAKINEATASYLEAKNRQLPSLKLSGQALALSQPTVDLKILPAGAGGSASATAHSAFLGNLSASWPIYAGGRIKYGIQSANYLLEAQKLSSENNRLAVAYTTAQAYNNLYKAQQAIQVLQENLKAAQGRDTQLLKLENNGLLARNDRLKANLQTSQIEIQLMEAQNNAEIANINMDILLGLPEDTVIDIDSSYADATVPDNAMEYYRAQASTNRNDLKAFEYQTKAADLAVKAARAEKLPQIALTGGYVSAAVPGVVSILNALNVGVGIQYDISNLWKNDASEMSAKARVQQIAASQNILNDQIALQVSQDFQNSRLASNKIAVYQKAEIQALENYRITKNKFDNGLATLTELLDADAAKVAAQISVLNAKADAALAFKKLQQTAGITY